MPTDIIVPHADETEADKMSISTPISPASDPFADSNGEGEMDCEYIGENYALRNRIAAGLPYYAARTGQDGPDEYVHLRWPILEEGPDEGRPSKKRTLKHILSKLGRRRRKPLAQKNQDEPENPFTDDHALPNTDVDAPETSDDDADVEMTAPWLADERRGSESMAVDEHEAPDALSADETRGLAHALGITPPHTPPKRRRSGGRGPRTPSTPSSGGSRTPRSCPTTPGSAKSARSTLSARSVSGTASGGSPLGAALWKRDRRKRERKSDAKLVQVLGPEAASAVAAKRGGGRRSSNKLRIEEFARKSERQRAKGGSP